MRTFDFYVSHIYSTFKYFSAFNREGERQSRPLLDDVGRHSRDVQPMRQSASDLTHAAHQGGGEGRLYVEGKPDGTCAEDGVEDAGVATSFRRWTISRSK